MIVAVHNHFNARKLCNIAISDAVAKQLAKPPALKDNWITLADGRRVNALKPEAHVVEIGSGVNVLRLFNATVNGANLVVTDTPDAAIAQAAS